MTLRFSSFIRRHWKKVPALIVLAVLLYLALCVITIVKIRSFRKHPTRTAALEFFQGDLPHNYIGRYFLFKTGSPEFNLDVLSWAYDSQLINDTSWNQWILENAVAQIPEEQRLELLALYPLTPSRNLLPDLRNALAKGQYRVLPVLNRMNDPEGRQASREWIERNIVAPKNSRLFVNASAALAESSSPNHFIELVDTFWRRLSKAEKQVIVAKLAGNMTRQWTGAGDILRWVDASITKGDLKLNCATVILMGKFLSIPSFNAQTVEIIAKRADQIEGRHARLLFSFSAKTESTNLARLLGEKIQDKNPALLIEIIHYAADTDIVAAEEIAKPFLAGTDSVLKKGVIVLLVRHDSVVGKRMIDDTFTGESPRKTLYLYSTEYALGNAASEMYRVLSTHDYKETGKTWPPSYLHGIPSNEEIAAWKHFIDSYPWFPATDDAFYRLGFSQFVQGDHLGCWSTIKQYLKRDYWPDRDASPYVYQLLRALVLTTNIEDDEMPFLPHLRNIVSNPLAGLATDQKNLDAVITSINWFLANPKYIEFLHTDRETLTVMRDTANTMKAAPPNSIWRSVAARNLRKLPNEE